MSIMQSDLTLRIRQAFEQARTTRAQGDLRGAIRGWTEVLTLTENATEMEHRQARMASSSECAVAYQELGDARRARELLIQAVELAEALQESTAGESMEAQLPHWMALAGVRTNLAALYIASREAELGVAAATAALEALEKAKGHPATGMLDFATRMQRGSGYLLLGASKEGVDELRQAIDAGIALVEQGQPQVLPQLVEAVGRMFAGSKMLGQAEENLPKVEQVARIATAAFEANGQQFLNIFVGAQMHRVNALLDVNRYADAEDELWHMIDGSGQGNILMSAPDFYVALWNRDDEALVKGGLPRAEIVDSWRDAIDQTEKRQADPVAVEVMRQRFRLYTEGAKDATRAFLEEQSKKQGELSQVAVALLNALQGELGSL